MNKKEVSEIKSLFKRDGGAIDRICGCLIDGEQQIRMTFSDMFLSLSQEEIDKYFEIFRKALSGSLGKNLHSLDYTLDQELSGEGHKRLMQLKATGLKDETVLEEFYKSVAETYHFGESYYVVMIHCNYDVPGRGSDNLDMDDASEEVYEFILCCICPVKLSEAGLCYNTQTNRVEERMRDQWIEAPVNAFLFPAFDDRSSNIHSLLYYSKNADEVDEVITDKLLGCRMPLPAKNQKETFNAIVEESLGLECDYEVVKSIHENLNQMVAENKENPEPLTLDKSDMTHLLEKCGVEEEQIEAFEAHYDESVGENETLVATNLSNTRNFEVRTPDVKVSVNPERTDLVETKVIDGVPCLVIEINDLVEVNGIQIVSELAHKDKETEEE